jgi:hypothetical protein
MRRFLTNTAGDIHLLCSMNYRGSACLQLWQPSSGGRVPRFVPATRSRKLPNSITGLDVGASAAQSPAPPYIAAVTSEGELFVFRGDTLRVMTVDSKAHMVFGTSVCVSGDGHAVVSTSGDASARVTELPAVQGGGGGAGRIFVLLLLLALALSVYVLVGQLGRDVSVWVRELQLQLEAGLGKVGGDASGARPERTARNAS